MRRFLCWLLLVLPSTALADGGHIALHATSGSVTITVFTSPEPLVTGPADFSVLVQDAASDEPLAGARVQGTLTTQQRRVPIGFARSGGLMAAAVRLPEAGSYRLDLSVESPGTPTAVFSTTLMVEASHERRTTVIVALVFPLVVIGLFLVNQQLKAHRRVAK